MTLSDIAQFRLFNHQIAETQFRQPHEVVAWLGAMQAQEFAMAKWAIGLRLRGLTDADVENAFNNGAILRTHLLRPTWHFVTPADIRWLLALTAPRVNAVNAYWYHKFELDSSVIKRSHDTIAKSLQGGKQLTRASLKSALAKVKVFANGLRLGYLMMRAELEGVICSGARQGKQFTYTLLDERARKTGTLDREEALAELTRRYFASRGPATLRDFANWSGLTMKESRAGLAMVKSHFVHEVIAGQDYFFSPTEPKNKGNLQTTFLMPDYDEYGISYKNRNALYNSESIARKNRGERSEYNHSLVIDGLIAGTWQRIPKGKAFIVETTTFAPLSKAQREAVTHAAKSYASFVNNAVAEVKAPNKV